MPEFGDGLIGRDSQAQRIALFGRYARLWAVVVVTLLAVLSVILISIGARDTLTEFQQGVASSVGSSLLASVIAYVLLSLFLEPRKQEVQTQRLAGFAIQEAQRQFRERFNDSLPTATYDGSEVPRRDFRASLVSYLVDSDYYDYMGASAAFTTFRLERLARQTSRIKGFTEVRLCIIDPRSKAPVEAQARHTSRTGGPLFPGEDPESSLRTDIFVTLVALFDLSATMPTNVYLHADLPLSRCEMFDNGMFLTYYLGRSEFPETVEYGKDTRHYRAHRAGIQLVREFATSVLRFGGERASDDLVATDEKLTTRLSALGCTHDLATLRRLRDERFEYFDGELKSSKISSRELF